MWNLNSGLGQILANDLHSGEFGKAIIVAKSGLAHRDLVSKLFPVDPDGKVRIVDDLDEAMTFVTANSGDRVYLLPGHTETISAAAAVTLDVAGVRIIGLGEGSLIPTFTFDTAATATFLVSSANVTIENVVFSANFADIAKVFDVTTAKNFKLKRCGFKATAANMNFLTIADTNTTDNAADGLTFEDCYWIEPDLATLSLVKVDGDLDGLTVKGCYVNLGVNTNDLPSIASVATGKDLTNLHIEDNDVIRLNDANPLLVTADTTTANTGIIKNNRIRHADTTGELLVTAATNIGFFGNLATAVADASGYTLPAADS